MEVEKIRQEVREGRIDAERLVDVIERLHRELQAATRELQAAKGQIEELKKKVGGDGAAKFSEPFSMRAEERRQEARGKKSRRRKRPARRGRLSNADKIALAQRTEAVFPDGVPPGDCELSHTRPVWRLENGQAVLVAYQIHRGPNNQYGKIPGVLGRGEFGLEIIVAIAYQVYIVGLSFDKVCLLMNFFQGLRLQKSQIDALLKRLSRHWSGEFDRLCALLAASAVVHADETSWSIKSVWAFLSEKVRLVFFGVSKDAATLEQILDPATFAGVVISDDAAVYANFTKSQKCWAHLLRKAIKLTLLEPTNDQYRQFTDRLLEIYREALRVQRDGRFGDEGRRREVAKLDDAILALCVPLWAADLPPLEGADDDYRLLCNELMRLMLARQLFTFVTEEPTETPSGETTPVAGTNNESERALRSAAMARTTGRANKTIQGARRQTIIVSVLESLRQYLPTFTLTTVIDEIGNWIREGQSCFAKLLGKLKLTPPTTSVLDRLLPQPSG